MFTHFRTNYIAEILELPYIVQNWLAIIKATFFGELF